MASLLERLKERKLVQWAIAYLAGAWVLVEASTLIVDQFHWHEVIAQAVSVLAFIGFFVMLVFAWYHGEKGRQRVSGPELLMVAALLVVAGAALTWVMGPSEDSSAQRQPSEGDEPRIAVLPCDNRSPNPEDAYVAEGLHEEIIRRLQGISSLLAIGRTSVVGFADHPPPVPEIAALLPADFIGECSVLKDPDQSRIRITFDLLDATGIQVWNDSYDRDLSLDDIFDILADIPQKIADAMGAFLTPAEQARNAARPTESQEAWDAYLRGEEYRLRPGLSRQNYEIAQQLFERAVARDPTFALAYASLAQVHGWFYWSKYDPSPARLERAREAAAAAVRLAPDLPQARWALGHVHYWDRDFARALEELTTVAEELPGSAELRSLVGYTHRRLGNWDETLAAFEVAAALNPRDAELFSGFGETFTLLHRYSDAIEPLNRALDLAPDMWTARMNKALNHLQWRGEPDSLQSLLEQGPEDYGSFGSRDLWRARLALWEHDPDTLLALLGAPEEVAFDPQSSYEPGLLYAAWAHQLRGEKDGAAQAFLSALAQLDSVLQEFPDDWRVHASRGLALAGLGRVGDARLEADWLTRSRVFKDAYEGPTLAEVRAMIFAQTGSVGDAIAELEPLLVGPSWTSAAMVRLDPRYDPIRFHPRFQALLEEYADDVEH